MNKAVFLDRDGVLNHTIFRDGKPRAPYQLEDFKLFSDVEEAIKLLKQNGFKLIVVTNQPDVARGWVSKNKVEEINSELARLLPLDDIKVCYHDTSDGCDCRKPKPGMLLEAARFHHIDLGLSFMIGDRHSDVEAGRAAGTSTILIGEGDHSSEIIPDFKAPSLLDAAKFILSR